MRPRVWLALLLVAISGSLFAQTTDNSAADGPVVQATPQSKAPAPPPATAGISGTIYCNDTHRPARGAIVMAQPLLKSGLVNVNLDTGMTRVGMDGTYTIHHLRPGDYTIVALLPGYISPLDDLQADQVGDDDAEMRAHLARNGVVSIRGNETAHMDLTIERGATISGRVLYDDGAPATQVIINLEDINAKPHAPKPAQADGDNLGTQDVSAGTLVRSFFLHQSQGTDDQGNFRISGIKPGTYRIAAAQPAESLADSDGDGFGILFGVSGDPKSVRIYAGGTMHKNTAKTYELRAGDDTTGVEITIPVYAFHRIEGHITTLDGHPIMSASLTLTDISDDAFVLHSGPARDGGFVFPEVPSGSYKLGISAAQIGTLPADFPDSAPIQSALLQNPESFADTTTGVIVKDSDITDLTIQLQNAQPAPSGAQTTASSPAQQ